MKWNTGCTRQPECACIACIHSRLRKIQLNLENAHREFRAHRPYMVNVQGETIYPDPTYGELIEAAKREYAITGEARYLQAIFKLLEPMDKIQAKMDLRPADFTTRHADHRTPETPYRRLPATVQQAWHAHKDEIRNPPARTVEQDVKPKHWSGETIFSTVIWTTFIVGTIISMFLGQHW